WFHVVLRARDVQPAPPQAAGAGADRRKRRERADPGGPRRDQCHPAGPGGTIMSSAPTIAQAEGSVAGVEQSEAPAAAKSNTPPGPPVERRVGRRVLAIGVLAVVILGGAFFAGTLPRLQQQREVDAAAAEAATAPP